MFIKQSSQAKQEKMRHKFSWVWSREITTLECFNELVYCVNNVNILREQNVE